MPINKKKLTRIFCALLCSAAAAGQTVTAYGGIHTPAVDYMNFNRPYPIWEPYRAAFIYSVPDTYDPALDIAKKAVLPEVKLTGNLDGMTKYTPKLLEFNYKYNNSDISCYSLTELQGNSSLNYKKKSYSLKLYADEDNDIEYKLTLGRWCKTENYLLKANWIDRTYARNIVASRLYKRMPNAMLPNGTYGIPDGFPTKLYINDSYKGIYTIVQPKKKKLFGLKDRDAVNGARLYSAEVKEGSAVFENSSALDNNWECKFPADHYDKTALNRLTEFISSCTYEEFKTYIGHYMDVDSLINYVVFSEITLNADGWRKNYNIVTYDGKIWYLRPYDLDCTFGLDFTGNIDEEAYTDTMSDWLNTTRLWILVKLAFPQEIYQRYREVRQNIITEDTIIAEFKTFLDKVGTDNYAADNTVWNRHNSARDALAQIKDYVKVRYRFLDEYMQKEFDHPCYISEYPSYTID